MGENMVKVESIYYPPGSRRLLAYAVKQGHKELARFPTEGGAVEAWDRAYAHSCALSAGGRAAEEARRQYDTFQRTQRMLEGW